LKTEKHLTYYI